jgi:hypothetical protein
LRQVHPLNNFASSSKLRVHPGSFCLIILRAVVNSAKDPGLTLKVASEIEKAQMLLCVTECLCVKSV